MARTARAQIALAQQPKEGSGPSSASATMTPREEKGRRRVGPHGVDPFHCPLELCHRACMFARLPAAEPDHEAVQVVALGEDADPAVPEPPNLLHAEHPSRRPEDAIELIVEAASIPADGWKPASGRTLSLTSPTRRRGSARPSPATSWPGSGMRMGRGLHRHDVLSLGDHLCGVRSPNLRRRLSRVYTLSTTSCRHRGLSSCLVQYWLCHEDTPLCFRANEAGIWVVSGDHMNPQTFDKRGFTGRASLARRQPLPGVRWAGYKPKGLHQA